MGRFYKLLGWARRRPHQFLIAWLVLVVLLVLAGGSYNLLQERERIFAKAGSTVRDYSHTLANRVEASIATAEVLLDFVATNIEQGSDLKNAAALERQFEKTLKTHPELMAVMVVSPDGHPASLSRPTMSRTLNFSDRDYFEYHRTHRGTELRISPPVISRLTGKSVIPITRRLNDARGNFAGIVFVGLNPAYFEQEFRKLDLGHNGSTAFTTADGTMLLRYPAVAASVGKSIGNWHVFNEVVRHQKAGVGESSCPVDGVARLHAFTHLTHYPVIAFTGISVDDLQAEWIESVTLKAPLLLGVLLALIGSGLLIYRQLRREAGTRLQLRLSLRRASSASQRAQILNDTLRKATGFQSAVLNSTACGILATDRLGGVTFMNTAASKMLGYSMNEIIGKVSPLIFHRTEDVREALRHLRPHDTPYLLMVAHANAHPAREWQFIRKNGTTVTVSLLITALKDDDGGLDGFVTIFNDLTELNRLEGLKSDFVSVVSHELRTPVTAIRGALSLHQAAVKDTLQPSQQRLLTIATDNCDRLIKIVSDILDIDKLARNKLSLQHTDQPLTALIERAIAQTQPFASLHGVTYRLGIDSEDLVLPVDADRLIQILVNLLSNAAKFSPPNSDVTVSAREEQGSAILRVVDRGIGIAEEFHPYVFERFSQDSSALTRKTGGTGLGLAITKMLVEAHGGKIAFTSAQGLGTTFVVSLPLRRPVSEPLGAGRSLT